MFIQDFFVPSFKMIFMLKDFSKLPKDLNAVLIFSNGDVYFGRGAGAKNIVIGEVCFNTSMTGYQEIITDPSYCNQIINFTFPHIGNVGCNLDDYESKIPMAKAVILRNQITSDSNHRAQSNLSDWLAKYNIPAITDVDTRAITRRIRDSGAQNVLIAHVDDLSKLSYDQLFKQLKASPKYDQDDLAVKVSCANNYAYQKNEWPNYQEKPQEKCRIIAIDYGAKDNIFRCLYSRSGDVIVVPATSSFAKIMEHKPNGIFLSNGPGDPEVTAVHAALLIQEIIKSDIPLFGICLGHQLLAWAIGAKTHKMLQGHRGANHPVLNLENGKVEITSQNHGYAIDEATLPDFAYVTHRSLLDDSVEGIALKNKPVFSVQYHPESSPGPQDSSYLFDKFITLAIAHKNLK